MKKKYLFLCLLINLLGALLIPLNLFVCVIPEWVSIVMMFVMTGSLVLFYIWGKGRKVSKIIATVLTLIFVIFTWFGTFCNPFWNTIFMRHNDYPDTPSYNTELSYHDAVSDLDMVMHYLKKDHPLFMHEVPEQIRAGYLSAKETLQNTDSITINMVEQEIEKMLSTLNDAHTTCYPLYRDKHYLRTIQEVKEQGYSLTEINHIPLMELVRQKKELFSYEVESWAAESLFNRINHYEGLMFLGIDVESGVTYTWEKENGEKREDVYYKEDFITYEEYMKANPQAEEPSKDFVFYEILKDKDIAILTVNKCRWNDTYRNCLKNFFTEVKDNGIGNVVVDLRENGGGSSFVAEEFIRYLDVDVYHIGTETWRFGPFTFQYITEQDATIQNDKYADLLFTGNVYALTSANTFSSAMLFANYIKDNHLGTLIGEAPGNAVTGYGEVAEFILPHSKLMFQTSTKYFTRADKETTDILVTPDIICDADEAMNELYIQIR